MNSTLYVTYIFFSFFRKISNKMNDRNWTLETDGCAYFETKKVPVNFFFFL